jgi:cell fate regulator YaaT (PSP1 superfamily)
MAEKVKDEAEALAICREKAEQRGLAMTIVDAEYQWWIPVLLSWNVLTDRDRRKLTFYFKADRRVDFRDLTKENFRIFKVCLSDVDGSWWTVTYLDVDGS